MTRRPGALRAGRRPRRRRPGGNLPNYGSISAQIGEWKESRPVAGPSGNVRGSPPVESRVTDHFATLRRGSFRALNGVVRPLVKRGLGSPPPVGMGTVVMSTTGRRSGLERDVPLVAARIGTHVVVSTVRSRSEWIRNLDADPNGTLWIDGCARAVEASVHRLPGLSLAVLRTPDRQPIS
jgi:hypothetical protein